MSTDGKWHDAPRLRRDRITVRDRLFDVRTIDDGRALVLQMNGHDIASTLITRTAKKRHEALVAALTEDQQEHAS